MSKGNRKSVWLVISVLFIGYLISACSLSNQQSIALLAIPEQVSYEDEIKLAQISQQIYNQETDKNTLIMLYYQRAITYDALGFRSFAQSDFNQILNYDPAVPDAYNYLGIYAQLDDDFDSAFLAFNTVIELNPDFEFAYINRAIALYQNGRYEQAQQDALVFYNSSPDEPIRLLWLYLIEEKIDSKHAKQLLHERYQTLADKTNWGGDIVAFYLGDINENQLITNLQIDVTSNRQLAERLCETYFYLGKYYQGKGNNKRAEQLFKLALTSNIYNYIEHQQALFELKQLNI